MPYICAIQQYSNSTFGNCIKTHFSFYLFIFFLVLTSTYQLIAGVEVILSHTHTHTHTHTQSIEPL